MKTKSLKPVIRFLLLGLALSLLGCPNLLQKDDQENPKGGISGTVLSVDGVDNSGITVTAEATDGIRSLSVQRALAGISPSSRAVAATAITDSRGAYSLKDLSPGTYTLTATSGDALERAVSSSVTVTASITVEASLMFLTRTGIVTGSVSLADAASPLGVVVFIAGSSYSAMAAADGSYTLSYVPAGSGYTLVASKTGYESAITSVNVKVAKTTTVETLCLANSVAPVTTGSVSGSVVSSDATAIPAAFVFLEGSQYICASNESGTFILDGVKPGNYSLTASKQGYDPASIPVSVTAGTATVAGVITLIPAPVTTPTGPFYVTYDANGATGGSVPVDPRNYMGGYKITVLGNSGNLHYGEQDFVEWNTKADGTGTAYTQGQTFTIGASTTLFAQYETPIHAGYLSAGEEHTMILESDGSLWAMGHNGAGQLGDGTTVGRKIRVPVISNVAMVSAGSYHTMILKTDGSLLATGNNEHGQLGDGTTTRRSTPVQVMRGVDMASAGRDYTMILKTDGSLWATGYNYYGQLGDGTTISRSTPVQVMSGVTMVSAGFTHTMILKTNGSLWATGGNGFGQLGDGTTISRNTPVQVMSGVTMVLAGGEHTLILKTDGSLLATGNEPPRDCRRPQSLRGYGHGQRNTVFTRGERTGGQVGIRAAKGI